MCRRRHIALLFSLLGLLGAVAAAPADAATRRVPLGFFGTVLDPGLTYDGNTSDASLDAQMGLMARSGVESVRLTFSWGATESAPGVYNWTQVDRLVATAARHRLSVLANVYGTPQWASEQPTSINYARYSPTDPQRFAGFMRQLIQRYGPHGSFWRLNPGLPRTPVRDWQIWNEEGASWVWASTPWQSTYARLLRAAYVAIRGADRGARVVAGSFVAVGPYSQWNQVRDLYRAGAKRYFDVISVHPFTNNPTSVGDSVTRMDRIIQYVRAQMRRYGDGRKPIIVTELSWPAAIGRVPPSRLLGLETTSSGQVQRLAAAYSQLARDYRRMRVTQVYWYTWASPYDANSPQSDVSYRFAGLVRFSADELTRPAGPIFVPMPLLRTYRNVAARYEGCRKRADARRCR